MNVPKCFTISLAVWILSAWPSTSYCGIWIQFHLNQKWVAGNRSPELHYSKKHNQISTYYQAVILAHCQLCLSHYAALSLTTFPFHVSALNHFFTFHSTEIFSGWSMWSFDSL
jgi:hypothetical protein